MIAKCRGCGAEIIWAFTADGHRMPLDAKFEGRFVLDRHKRDDGTLLASARATYLSHFATCPQADKFRKRKAISNQDE